MDMWVNWALLAGIFGMALIAPGPDLVMAVRNSIIHSRQAGIFTAFGFALGVGVHVTYTLTGIAVLISKSVLLFNIIKFAGAAYLFYMGYKALRSKGFEDHGEFNRPAQRPMSNIRAIRSGFLTNLLNPKATLFFVAIFSQFVGPDTSTGFQILYGLTCVVMCAVWFSLVALLLTGARVKSIFLRTSRWIDRVCGVLFIGLGVRLALSVNR